VSTIAVKNNLPNIISGARENGIYLLRIMNYPQKPRGCLRRTKVQTEKKEIPLRTETKRKRSVI
jgi:hypothetical protein